MGAGGKKKERAVSQTALKNQNMIHIEISKIIDFSEIHDQLYTYLDKDTERNSNETLNPKP